MAMTREEKYAKQYIQNKMAKEGYPTYARLLGYFDLNLTKSPSVIGFMEPSKGRIVINSGLDEDQVSVVIRHEILHQYLDHETRLLRKLAKDANLDYDTLMETDINKLKSKLYANKKFNIAADYEISNRGYTDKDKETIRNLNLNGKILSGLVTEDKHPDWVDLSVEEMYQKLNEEKDDIEPPENQDDSNDDDSDENESDDDQNSQSEEGDSSEDSDGGNSEDSAGSSGDSDDELEDDENSGGINIPGENNSGDDSSDSDSEGGGGSEGNGDSQDNDSQDNGGSDDADDTSDSSSSNGRGQGKGNGKGSSSEDSSPEIGDTGDIDELEQEDREREEQARKEAEEDGEGSNESEEDYQKRLDKIKKALNDDSVGDQVLNDSDTKVGNEKKRKKAAEEKEIRNNLKGAAKNQAVIQELARDLKKFVAKQVGDSKRVDTWKKYNGNYDGSGLIRKGHRYEKVGKIPVVQMYIDQSGSFNENDIKMGFEVLNSIKQFEQKKEIKLEVYYFANHVETVASVARMQGGTAAGPEIMQQIIDTKPDNVIILTDHDISENLPHYQAPGGVWFIFRDTRSKALMNALSGKMVTRIYDVVRVR